ncbi:MAG: glycosyl hydrolase family 65 protein [Candidatus Omnitrophota bacterium]
MKKTPYTWKIFYNNFEPEQEGLREVVCTLGNGYFGTRGNNPESVASEIHYPGTYIAGLYNRLTTRIAGRRVVNEDFVNCPNWTFLTFRHGEGKWFCPSTSKVHEYYQELDMRGGTLSRRIVFRDWKGQKTLIETMMLVHMGSPHIGAVKYVITPKNYNGWITVGSMLDGLVLNTGVERYRKLNSKHLEPCALGSFSKSGIFLSMKTNQSKIEIAEASKIRIIANGKEKDPFIKQRLKGKEMIGQEFKIFVHKNKSYEIEKIVSIYTSQDNGVSNPIKEAINSTKKAPKFAALLKTHKKAWAELWDKVDIQIEGDSFSQKMLRLNMFHLLQSASLHNIKIDAGLPARGLHGEAYRGHIFWDGIFSLPFYNFHIPQISKALLMYRYRRLLPAREYAKAKGYIGAMFPWQSASSGREETQILHLNPMSGEWDPDYSSLQRHVSFAILYNTWQYYKITGDFDFLLRYGAEMILSIAQFAGSLTKYSPKDGKFHTKGIMGPDEFHEAWPGSSKPGLNDNAYTNFMIVWSLLIARKVICLLPEAARKKLLNKIGITQKELDLWHEITHKMNIIFNSRGIISQFEGYFKLKELDWDNYRAKYRTIQRMDRILKALGKSPDAYKVTKQADVLMIFYLFPLIEVTDLFRRLGYSFDRNNLKKNYEYYAQRTSHGSTLSKVVHCLVARQLQMPQESWQWFIGVLESDFYDIQGGTTPEGIHTGVMGGSIDIVTRSFAGINILDGHIRIRPNLPKSWQKIKLKFLYKGKQISLSITKSQIIILIKGPRTKFFKVPIEINDRFHHLPLGRRSKISLRKRHY